MEGHEEQPGLRPEASEKPPARTEAPENPGDSSEEPEEAGEPAKQEPWKSDLRECFPNIDAGIDDFKMFLEALRSLETIRSMGSVYIISSGTAQDDNPKQVGFSCRQSNKHRCASGFKLKRNSVDNKLYLVFENMTHKNHPRITDEQQLNRYLSFLSRRKKIQSSLQKNKWNRTARRGSSSSNPGNYRTINAIAV